MKVQIPFTLPLWECMSGHIHRYDEPVTEATHLPADGGGQVFGVVVVPQAAAELVKVHVELTEAT